VAFLVGIILDRSGIAVLGGAMFILGALFPRLEGPVEAGVQGVKANLASQEVIERDDLREEVRELGHRLKLTAESIEGKVMDVDRVLPPDARVVIEDSGTITSRADLRGTAELVTRGMASAIIGGATPPVATAARS
jgi:hypothetical protein